MPSGKVTLAAQTAHSLRSEITAGGYLPGTRLPTEFQLARDLKVSRSTVRAAIKELSVLGLVRTEHGVGTFVVEQPTIRAGLERLDSITESIRSTGRTPGMKYASRLIRSVMPEEAARMEVPADTKIVELRRTIFADQEVMAFSYDLVPLSLFPKDFDIETITGSLFGVFMELGIKPDHSNAQIHAVNSRHVGWGPDAENFELFVLLNQRHYGVHGELILYSRTYFIEGRYEFTIERSYY